MFTVFFFFNLKNELLKINEFRDGCFKKDLKKIIVIKMKDLHLHSIIQKYNKNF